ncbi:MAG TPA: baseplate J/gp47 family protein, partial [Candidatus Limnocylindrales bacterium]
YLDADAEITSAAARIRAIDDDRVAVVLPFGSRVATSRINFRLLAHEATVRGKTIEIIAADASARALAMTAGLTVHPSVAAFESGGDAAGEAGAGGAATAGAVAGAGSAMVPSDLTTVIPVEADDDVRTGVILVPRAGREPVPVVGRVRPPVRTGVAAAIALGVVALIAVASLLAFTLLPSATIVLSPWSRDLGPQRVDVVADPTVTSVDEASLTVPAQKLTFQLSVQQTFPATGVKVTDTAATGTVQFANFDTGRGVFIPKGTKVRTSSKIEFATTADLTLPRAGVDFLPPFNVHPSTASVGIQAVEAGPDGNVGASSITIVEGGGNRLRVNNPDPTTGGEHSQATVVSQDDIDKAVASLNAALPAELDRQIAGVVLPSGATVYPESKVIGTTTPSVDLAALVGQEASTFDLGLTAPASVLDVDGRYVSLLANGRLQALVDAGWRLDDTSIDVQIGSPAVAGDRVTFPVTIAAREVHFTNQATLLAEVKGLDIPAARARLDDFGSVEVRVWPDWVTTIPNSDRTTLTIGDPVPEPSPSP